MAPISLSIKNFAGAGLAPPIETAPGYLCMSVSHKVLHVLTRPLLPAFIQPPLHIQPNPSSKQPSQAVGIHSPLYDPKRAADPKIPRRSLQAVRIGTQSLMGMRLVHQSLATIFAPFASAPQLLPGLP